MSERKLSILGTAALVPSRERNHNGCFLQWDDEGFLFDPGEGLQRQLIFSGISATQISKIFITHFHGDHCLGLAGIAQRISLDQVPHPVRIFYPASGEEYLDRLLNASIYYKQATFVKHPIDRNGKVYKDDNLTIEAHRLDHGIDCFGYKIKEHDSYSLDPKKLQDFELSGRIVGKLKREGSVFHNNRTITITEVGNLKPGQKISFIMDSRYCQAVHDLAAESDLIICESTFLPEEAEAAKKHGHLTVEQAATIAKQAGAGQLVLTHFSGRHPYPDPYREVAERIFPGAIVAKDGDKIDIKRIKRK